ncbi:MAG: YjfB family protein [Planctomycetota bacterium]
MTPVSADLGSAISVAVARKSLDTQQAQGDAMVDLISEAAAVGAQTRGAISATPTPSETGQNLDVTA